MRYVEPSIMEALCELIFSPGVPWDFTVFGRFDAELGEQLPVREQMEVMKLNVRKVEGGIEQAMEREPRLRFFSADRTRLAQVGPNILTANVLPPYPHWPPFKEFILRCLEAYVKAARPAKIERMTLRYVDRIVPARAGAFRLGDWVHQESPYIPSFLHESTGPAVSSVQRLRDGILEGLSIAVQPDPQGAPAIVMDTTLVVTDVALGADEVGVRLDALHRRVVEVFEDCISDVTRAQLKPEKM